MKMVVIADMNDIFKSKRGESGKASAKSGNKQQIEIGM